MKSPTARAVGYGVLGSVAIWLTSSSLVVSAANETASTASSAQQHWQAECGECHLAYAPRLLPATSWRALMSRLESHFGVDASLDALTARAIEQYLVAGANAKGPSSADRTAPANSREQSLPRITTSAWFRRQHDDITATAWKLQSIGSASNCGACHTDAAAGRFRESAIRLPADVVTGRGDEHKEKDDE